jgi:AcrR family transcriptional regulator
MTSSGTTDPRTALLDAVEEILVQDGHAAATTRVVAAGAGVNPGLVHYYFGSLDALMFAALDRHTRRLHERQSALYAEEGPFLPKWRKAMQSLIGDDRRYAKLWLEMASWAWNKPEHRDHLHQVAKGWREILRDAFEAAAEEYGVDTRRFPIDGLVALVMTFNQGIQLEQAIGIEEGHQELMAMIDRLLTSWQDEAGSEAGTRDEP